MKEATGELNTTVFVVLAISFLVAFFYYTIWPVVKAGFTSVSNCSKAICEPCTTSHCETVTCHLKNSTEEFECVYKG